MHPLPVSVRVGCVRIWSMLCVKCLTGLDKAFSPSLVITAGLHERCCDDDGDPEA